MSKDKIEYRENQKLTQTLKLSRSSNITLIMQNQLLQLILELGSASKGGSRSESGPFVLSRHHKMTNQSRKQEQEKDTMSTSSLSKKVP